MSTGQHIMTPERTEEKSEQSEISYTQKERLKSPRSSASYGMPLAELLRMQVHASLHSQALNGERISAYTTARDRTPSEAP